jgi:hypothetical protein
MPDKPTKKYVRERRLPPELFQKETFRTVKPTHAPEKKIRERRWPKGTKVVAGKLKKPRKIREKKRGVMRLVEKKYATQTVLIPKSPRKAMRKLIK